MAMVIATIKALLVALFFMNLLYDRRKTALIFATAFLFLAIFHRSHVDGYFLPRRCLRPRPDYFSASFQVQIEQTLDTDSRVDRPR